MRKQAEAEEQRQQQERLKAGIGKKSQPPPQETRQTPVKEPAKQNKKPADDDEDDYGDDKFEKLEEEYPDEFDEDGQEENPQPQKKMSIPEKKIIVEPEEPEAKNTYSKPNFTLKDKNFKPEPIRAEPVKAKQEEFVEPVQTKSTRLQQQTVQQRVQYQQAADSDPEDMEEEQPPVKAPVPSKTQQIRPQNQIQTGSVQATVSNEVFEDPRDKLKVGGSGFGAMGTKPIKMDVVVDEEIRAIQRERVKYLREYIGLDFEKIDNLDMNPISEYEVYVNRINGGGIKNSNDQTNDENQTRET